MKQTFLLTVACVLQLSATVYSQATKFSFEMKNQRRQDVLRELEKTRDFFHRADGYLHGTARIAGRKLDLDGNNSCTETDRRPPFAVQSMFYKARSPRTGNMWDTWMCFHEGTYYLYYLGISGNDLWDNVSMAVSPDGVHWKEIGPVFSMDPQAMSVGSGSTWKSPNFEKDGKFFINFVLSFPGSETAEGSLDLSSRLKNGFPPKTILFGESTDLIHWRWLERAQYGFVPDSRFYEPGGAWDCISAIPRPGGGLFGYWTATPKAETGGTVGFGQSLDGVRWEALPPPKTPGVVRGEIGGVEKIGGKFYMMQGHDFVMRTLIADQPQGPFLPARKNFRLLSGHTYFTRFLRTPHGLLVNHHASSFKPAPGFGDRQVYFSPLKSAVVDDEGVLRLGWWKGNERMKHEPIEVISPNAAPGEPATIAMLGNTFDTPAGIVLEGTLKLPDKADSPRRGLYIECGDSRGSAVLLDDHGAAELGPIRANGAEFKAEKRVDREMTFGRPATFRLLLKETLLEFYLDDILIECFSLPADATGRIGLICGSDSRAIGELKAWH
jgi:hypothetical protein